jgi:chemotaxis protein MotB
MRAKRVVLLRGKESAAMSKQVMAAVLGFCLVGLVGCPELQDLRKQNASLNSKVLSLQTENQRLFTEKEALKAERDRLEADLTEARAEGDKSSGLLGELRAEQQKLQQQNTDLQTLLKGIPGTSVRASAEGNYVVTESEILFDPGQIELKAGATAALDKVVEYLQAHSDTSVRIDGHTDGVPIRVSAWKDNYHLSAMRAHAVMRYLVDKGVAAERMFIAGFGPNRPRVPPKEPTADVPKNRRVEILLVPGGVRTIGEILEGIKE